MNIIFLDIDGVLNTVLKFPNSHTNYSNISESKLHLLSKIVKSTNAHIVLHSGWRFEFDSNLMPLTDTAAQLVRKLHKFGLEIYDLTPDLTTEEIRITKKFSRVKADEILMWLTQHKNIKKWVVLDDLDLNNPKVTQNQIQVSPVLGLTEKNVIQAINFLLSD